MHFDEPFRFAFADAVVLKEELHPLAVGSVTQGKAGGDATVTLRRDGDTFFFDFVIPRGIDGEIPFIDAVMNGKSRHPVQNRAIKAYVDEKDELLRRRLEEVAATAMVGVTPKKEMTALESEVTLIPNVYYVFPEMTRLTVRPGGVATPDRVQKFHFRFTSGATPTMLAFPEDWVGEIAVETGRTYEVSVTDGYLSVKEWEVEA